jgi:hypothetical protein
MSDGDDDSGDDTFTLKEGNATQCLTINDYQNSHHHIDTSRIIDTGLSREWCDDGFNYYAEIKF